MSKGVLGALGRLVLLVVTLAVPLLLVTQRTLAVLHNPDVTIEAVERYWLDEDAVLQMGQAYAREKLHTTPTNDQSLIFWRALAEFTPDQWHTLMAFVAPQEIVTATVEEGIRAFHAWLEAPQAQPEARISLTRWKQHVSANTPALTDWFLAQFRACNMLEMAAWGEAWVLNDWSRAPLCLPAGASSQVVKESLAAALRQAVGDAPDTINILDPRWVPLETLQTAKLRLAQAQEWLARAWMLTGLLLLLGLALVVRSWGGLFKALGSVAGWSGLALVLLAARPGLLAAQIAARVDVPTWAHAAFQDTVAFYLQHILSPLRVPGIGLMIAGAAAWLVGFLLATRGNKAAEDTLSRLEM